MNDPNLTWLILISIAEIFGLLLIGGAGRLLGYIDERDIDRWSRLVIDILFPAMIFTSITSGFQVERLHELWILPVIGFSIAAGGFFLGLGLQFGLGTGDGNLRRTFLYFCTVNNYTFLPIVIVKNLWGDPMLASLFFLTIGSQLAHWTIGIGALGSTDVKNTVKNLCTPGLVTTLVSLAVAWLGWGNVVPPMATNILKSAGSVAVPTMIILAGASMFKPSVFRLSWQIIYSTVVRLLILPLVAILLLKLLVLPADIYAISIIVAIMPLAVSTVIYTRIFGGDPDFAAGSILFTTVVSIASVPLTLWLVFR
jgi:hypothetical protein